MNSVNGKPLSSGVLFSSRDIVFAPSLGASPYESSKFVAFETIKYEGIPSDAWEGGQSPIAQSRIFGVYNCLTLVRAVEDAEEKDK